MESLIPHLLFKTCKAKFAYLLNRQSLAHLVPMLSNWWFLQTFQFPWIYYMIYISKTLHFHNRFFFNPEVIGEYWTLLYSFSFFLWCFTFVSDFLCILFFAFCLNYSLSASMLDEGRIVLATTTGTLHSLNCIILGISSSCCATSTDIPDPLSPLLPIIHRFWQVLRATSRILTELLYVGSSWSSCFCSAIWRGS